MDSYKELEIENQQQRDLIELLNRDINGLKRDKEVLKTFLKEEKLVNHGFVRQGLRLLKDGFARHYVVFRIKGIPVSLDILDIKEIIQGLIQPFLEEGADFYDYELERMDYSERKKTWYVQIMKEIDVLK